MGLRYLVLIVAAATLASCNGKERSDPPSSIWYSHEGCYGTCPVFEIHVDRRGHGTFKGHAYTAVHGTREFQVTSQQFEAFASTLDAARRLAKPFNKAKNVFDQINADFLCPPNAPSHTDDSAVFVMWSERQRDSFYYAYFGCDSDRNKQFYLSLDKAPDELGLKNLIEEPNLSTPP